MALSGLRGAAVGTAAAGLLTVVAEAGGLVLPFEWNGWPGVDLLGPKDLVLDPATGGLPEGITACGAEAVEVCRIDSGLPAMGSELTEKTIAAEAALVERTVNFTKGCYTGQELVARLDARGNNVARRLVGVVGGADRDGPDLAYGMTLHAGVEPPATATERLEPPEPTGSRGRQGGRHRDLGRLESRTRRLGGPGIPPSHRREPGPGAGQVGRRARRVATGSGGAPAIAGPSPARSWTR